MNQKIQTARNLIEQFKIEKYQFDPVTGKCLLPEDAKSDYDNALKILSEQLYSKDIHFIFELIQNAEDNHYHDNDVPALSFELLAVDPTNTPGCKGCLVVRNNETGFEISNIKAISSIGKSTKANQKDAGYIGEKGIGFKSVFVVSPAPHILSNGFQIKFLKDDRKTGLGYIVPYWLESNFNEYASSTGTTLLLPLQDVLGSQTSMFDKVQNELAKLSAELVLFLRKLKKLSIKTPNYIANYELSRQGDYVELSVDSSNGDSRSTYLLKTESFKVPDEAINGLRENVSTRDISLAFPINFELEESPLYCYLPTESNTGLPFLVNADFILNASREAIRQDLVWNSWMRDEVASFAAKTLAEILSTEGEISRWAWVPGFNSERRVYWNIVREKVYEALSTAKCIPTQTGNLRLPSEALLLPRSLHFLKDWPVTILRRLSKHIFFDELGLISRVSSSIGLYELQRDLFVELLQTLRSSDVLEDEQIVPMFIEITSQSSSQKKLDNLYKYQDKLSLLRDCNLFKCRTGLQSAKYKNIYLPSNENHQVPILENDEGESTKPNYIDRDFYALIPDPVKMAIRYLFNIDEVHAVSYLEQSVCTFLKENGNACSSESLEAVTKYLLNNIEDIPVETVSILSEVFPFLDVNQQWVFPKQHVRYVAPSSLFEATNWKQIYKSKEELQHIVELHEDYLVWGAEGYAEQLFDAFQINEYVRPFQMSTKGGGTFPATPISFLKDNYWDDERHRKATFQWLYWVYKEAEKVTYSQKSIDELGYFLLHSKWLLSTNEGFVQPSPLLHCFSDSERSIFGSSLNYLKDNVTKAFAKKLGLITEPTPKGFMDQIKTSKDNGEVNEALLVSAYEALSNWRDQNEAERIKRRLTQDRLIYLPKPRDEWLSPQQVTWEDKPDLGASFVGLKGYLPERLRYYFVESLLVNEYHGLSSYISAYNEISSLKNNKLSSSEVQRLNTIVRQLSHFMRDEDFVVDDAWNSFAAKCKIYSDKGVWLEGEKAIFVADDGKTKELFASHPQVHFTWSNSTEFFSFFEQIGVKKASEFIEVQISNISKGKVADKHQIATSAKKAICTYIADHYSIDDELFIKLSKFYDSTEQLCEQITVKYILAGKQYVEVTNELGFYDSDNGLLLLVENQDIADVKDELALSIARMFFGRKANQHEKAIRVFIDISSYSRLSSVLKKEGLELDAEKAKLLDEIFEVKAPLDSFVAPTQTAEEESYLTELDESKVASDDSGTAEVDLVNSDASSFSEQSGLGNVYGNAVDQPPDSFDEMPEAKTSYPSINGSKSTQRGESFSGMRLPKVTDKEIAERQLSQDVDDSPISSSTKTGHSRQLDSENKNSSGRESSPNGRSDVRKSSETNRTQATQNASSSVGYRLFSYVESEKTHELTDRFERDDINFGNKAELYVKQWLSEQGLMNIELLGGVNKGFDIQAVRPETGEVIFVEIKGQRGHWNRTGVALSKSQMEKCLEARDNYWLVVVENLLSKPVIHKFVNPASLIDRYYFDSNWAKIADFFRPSESQQIDLDDLFFDEASKLLYQYFQQHKIPLPEVGFEISNDRFEVIAELEFAWPELRLGIYTDVLQEQIEGWTLYSVAAVKADLSLISRLIAASA